MPGPGSSGSGSAPAAPGPGLASVPPFASCGLSSLSSIRKFPSPTTKLHYAETRVTYATNERKVAPPSLRQHQSRILLLDGTDSAGLSGGAAVPDVCNHSCTLEWGDE